MDPAFLAQQATNILAPALPFIYAGGKAVVDKSKDMLLEKGIEKFGSEGGKRAKALLDKISPKMGESLEKALTKVSSNSDDPEVKEELQQEILKLLRENSDLAREIELIVNVNIDIDVVKQLVFGGNNLIFNLEGVKGEELIKIMEYMEWKRQEELKQEVLRNYSPSILPDFPETLVKSVTENRAEELSSALRHLQKNKILLFSGIAGVGKTTLARVLVNFRPTGVPEPFWFNFYHNRDAKLEDVLEALAAYLEAPEILSFKGKRQAGNTDINRLTEELRKRDSLWLVFDDLSYIIDEEQKFIDSGLGLLFKALTGNTHNAKIILTSRVMPLLENGEYLIDELEDENRQKIEGLKPEFAVNYLRENGFDNIELITLESLVESVGGHPFSLKLLAGLAKKHTAENILKDLSLYRKHQKDRIKNARFLFDKLVLGDIKKAIECHKQALKISKEVGDICREGHDLGNLGNTYILLGDSKKSIEYYKQALKIFRKIGYRQEEGKTLEGLGIAYNFLGEPREAIEYLEQALKISKETENKRGEGSCLGNLGLAYSHLGEPRKAIEYYEQALKISREIGDRRGEGNHLGNLGLAYSDLGELRKAIEYCDQALKISREIGDRSGEGNHLGNLGLAYSHMGELRKAIEYYEQALRISRKIGDRRGEDADLGNLGNAYSDLGESRKAIEYQEKALEISKEIGDRKGEGADLGNLGNAYSDLGEPRRAIEFLKEFLAIGKAIEDPRIISFCEKKLKELDEVKDNENSSYHPGSNNSQASNHPLASKNLIQTIVSKLKFKK